MAQGPTWGCASVGQEAGSARAESLRGGFSRKSKARQAKQASDQLIRTARGGSGASWLSLAVCHLAPG